MHLHFAWLSQDTGDLDEAYHDFQVATRAEMAVTYQAEMAEYHQPAEFRQVVTPGMVAVADHRVAVHQQVEVDHQEDHQADRQVDLQADHQGVHPMITTRTLRPNKSVVYASYVVRRSN